MTNLLNKIGQRAKKLVAACAAVVALSLSAASYAAPLALVDFKPDPAPLGFPELNYDITVAQHLSADIGATGNSSVGAPGGLLIETPFLLDLGPDYAASVTQTGVGTTQFRDVTLVLHDLAADVPAIITNIGGGLTFVTQKLASGSFALLSHDPDGAGPKPAIALLTGSISDAFINGVSGGNSGAVVSATVTYNTGTVIGDALYAADGTMTGDLSWSLLPLVPSLTASGPTPTLNSFKADMTGSFGTPRIPEPSMAGLLALGGLGMVARRRTR